MGFERQETAVRTFGQRGVRSPQARPARPEPARTAASTPTATRPGADAGAGTSSGVERFLGGIPLLTCGLVVGLALVFALEQALAFDVGPNATLSEESLVALGAVSFERVVGLKEAWRIFLAPLIHANSSHLLGNCFAMAMVGLCLEPLIGRGWFALIFAASALGGVAGSLIGNELRHRHGGRIWGDNRFDCRCIRHEFPRAGRLLDDARKMRRRALFFGLPALLPALFRRAEPCRLSCASGRSDHRRRNRAGFVQCMGRRDLPPAGARRAGQAGLAALAASFVSCAFVVPHYAEQAAIADTIMPQSIASQPFNDLADRSASLVDRHPTDPRAQLIRAVFFLKANQPNEAQALLRRTMTMEWPARRSDELSVQKRAQAMLALVLQFEHRRSEASALANNICADKAHAELWPMLIKANLCKG